MNTWKTALCNAAVAKTPLYAHSTLCSSVSRRWCSSKLPVCPTPSISSTSWSRSEPLQTAPCSPSTMRCRASICLVDADNFMEQIQDVEMIRLQLCHCHLAVINKADLVSPELLTAIKAQIRRINPDCDISSCSYGGFSLELLENDLLSHSTDEGEQDLPAELRPDSIVLNCIHRLPREKVIAFIKQFVPETYRIKGFCLFEDGWNQVDVVGSRISFSRCMPHSSSRLIFISKIGHALSEPIRQSWNELLDLPMQLHD